MTGRNIRTIKSNEQQIDIYKYKIKSGIYFIHILDGKKQIIKKIIIN